MIILVNRFDGHVVAMESVTIVGARSIFVAFRSRVLQIFLWVFWENGMKIGVYLRKERNSTPRCQ